MDGFRVLKKRKGAYLPHWTYTDGIYAVTFRLNDSLPVAALNALKLKRHELINNVLKQNSIITPLEQREIDYAFSEKVQDYLDAGHGECFMKIPAIADLVERALFYFHGSRYRIFAWCVMPNHVHVLVQPINDFPLDRINHSWKSFTAKEANRLLGRTGAFWQTESYDHLIRNDGEFVRTVEYILSNPVRANLRDWKWVGRVARE